MITAAVIALLYWFFGTEYGCALRATGANVNMARAQGINTGRAKVGGLMLSNAMHLSSWTGKPVFLPIDEGEFVRLLAEKRLHSRKKQVKEVTFATDHSGTGRAEG